MIHIFRLSEPGETAAAVPTSLSNWWTKRCLSVGLWALMKDREAGKRFR